MKELFIEAQKELKLNKEKLKELEKILPSAVYIAYSIQYKKLAEQVRKALENSKKRIIGFSQILGCSDIKAKSPILLVGEARFHALNLALSSGKEVYIFDNFSINKIYKEEINKIKAKEKGKYLRFLTEREIGIIASTKEGQGNMKLAETIKNKIDKKGKKSYLFLADSIKIQELENFPLKIFINTACPELELDSGRIISSKHIEL